LGGSPAVASAWREHGAGRGAEHPLVQATQLLSWGLLGRCSAEAVCHWDANRKTEVDQMYSLSGHGGSRHPYPISSWAFATPAASASAGNGWPGQRFRSSSLLMAPLGAVLCLQLSLALFG